MTNAEQKANDALSRFEARTAEEEESKRPNRTANEALVLARKYIRECIYEHENRVTLGLFDMKSQEKAALEEIDDMRWLIQDLEDIENYGFIPDNN